MSAPTLPAPADAAPPAGGGDRLARLLAAAGGRMRTVRLVRYTLTHLAAAFGLLALVAVLDKSGLVLLSGWGPSGVWREGGWATPSLAVPPLYRMLFLLLTAAALGSAFLRAWLENPPAEAAALALDARLGLKERFTSARALADSAAPMAGLLAADAARAAAAVRLAQVFPLRGGGRWRWLGAAGLAAAGALFLLPRADLLGERARREKARMEKERARREVEAVAAGVRRTVEELRQDSARRAVDPKTLDELTKRMEELARKLEEERAVDPELARTMLNRLREEMRRDLEALREREQRMRALKPADAKRSPLSRLRDRLRKNDPAGAAEAMRRMRRRLRKNGMNRDELRRLSKEMRDLAGEMDRLGLRKLQKQFQDLSDRLHDLQEANDAMRRLREKLADKLRDLQSQGPDLSRLTEEERELLRKLQEAMRKMEYTEEQLEKMAQAAEEGRVRQLTLEELRRMLQAMKNQGKNQKGQSGCTGEGCGGMGLAGIPGAGGAGGRAGQGTGGTGGAGRGAGGRPPEREHETEKTIEPIRARRLEKGQIVGQWFVRGLPPEEAEELTTEYNREVEAVRGAPETVRERETVPPEARTFLRDYQNAIRR